MSNSEFISQNEIDEISKIQVDSNMLEKVKKRQVRSLKKVLLDNIFEEVRKNLESDENVEFYVIGRNYTLQNIRLMFSLMGSVISNPIFGWSTNNILINTNKRFLIVETVGYLQYSKIYEINKELHLFKEKSSFYLTVKDTKGKKIINQYDIQNFEIANEYLKDNANVIIDKKFKYKAEKITKIIVILEVLLILILFTIGICTANN